MRYGPTTTLETPGEALMQGYIDFVADIEAEQFHFSQKVRTSSLGEAARYIGAGCTFANDQPEYAITIFQQAEHTLAPYTNRIERRGITNHNYMGASLSTVAGMLALQHAGLDSFLYLRRQLQTDTIVALESAQCEALSTSDNEVKMRAHGQITELTAIALAGRHPWIFSTPSLIHHDAGPVPSQNFDQVIVEAMPGRTALAQKIQAKGPCQGFCGKPQPNERKRYAMDIALISGECDFGIRRSQSGRWQFPFGDLLVKESCGDVTPEETAQLDTATNSLLLTVTADPSRRGRHRKTHVHATRQVHLAAKRAGQNEPVMLPEMLPDVAGA